MLGRDTHIAIYALIIIVIASQFAAWSGVDLDAGVVTMTALTAIAALVRGDGQRRGDGESRP